VNLDKTFFALTKGTVKPSEWLPVGVIFDTHGVQLPGVLADVSDLWVGVGGPGKFEKSPVTTSEEESVANHSSGHDIRVVRELGTSTRDSLGFFT